MKLKMHGFALIDQIGQLISFTLDNVSPVDTAILFVSILGIMKVAYFRLFIKSDLSLVDLDCEHPNLH